MVSANPRNYFGGVRRKLVCMRKKIIVIAVFTVMICMGSQPVLKARGYAGSTSGAGTATLTGIIKFEGNVPRGTTISMVSDPSCAKQHPTPVLSQDVVADAKGGVQNVVVFITDGLGDRTFDPPPSEPVVIEQKGCLYRPHVLAMRANQPLEVRNEDPTLHNIHPVPTNNLEWNKAEPPGSNTKETFLREEIAIPVKCNIHPWMRGYVAVFKHPYFAVSGKDGRFELSKLPAGTYSLKAWHEKLGTSVQQITVGAGENKVVEFVFKSRG
jgi:hypothetical protein